MKDGQLFHFNVRNIDSSPHRQSLLSKVNLPFKSGVSQFTVNGFGLLCMLEDGSVVHWRDFINVADIERPGSGGVVVSHGARGIACGWDHAVVTIEKRDVNVK